MAVSVSTDACKVARVAVSPAALSGLVASAQQFREQSQAEVCSRDRALIFGLVRPQPKPSCEGCHTARGPGPPPGRSKGVELGRDPLSGYGAPTRHCGTPRSACLLGRGQLFFEFLSPV